MKTTSWNTILIGISAFLVLALAGMPIQNAQAMDSIVLNNLQIVHNDIAILKENTQNFDIKKIGSQTFNFRQVGDALLEIQNTTNLESNDNEMISKVLDYLIKDYKETFNEYRIQLEQYEKHNSIDLKQTQIKNELIQNYIDFSTDNDSYNEIVNQDKFIRSEITRLQNEEKFQSYINKVAKKIVDANNGNRVQKIYHEVALAKIAEEENWDIIIPAMDRIINQFSNPEIKQYLEMYKEKILYTIGKLEKSQQKQPQILALTNNDVNPSIFGIIFNEDNEIQTSSIILAQLKSEIKSIISDSQKIIDDENTKIETILELQRAAFRDEERKNTMLSESVPQSAPEPIQQSTSEPESAPEFAPESQPEVESAPEPIQQSTSEPESAPEFAPEPEPVKENVGNSSDKANDKANENANEKAKENSSTHNDGNDKGKNKK
jgi:hypothetical protein